MQIKMYGYSLNLNDDTLEITGKTFDLKNNLKGNWGCTWNPANKSWTLPEKNKADFIAKFATNEQPKVTVATTTTKTSTICPICKTYCHGDCRA